tara:strand:- start:835 stop:6852 length:6018 start_codon:yes stop_codon:yes gene_type:complete
MYYAETFDENLNCYSTERSAVALLEVQIPSLDISSKTCEDDQSTYTLVFTTDANTVNTDQGTLEKLIGPEWMVTDIPSGMDIKLRLTNNVTLCERVETIEAPNCECQTVGAPVSDGSKVVCLDDTYPILSVNLVQENVTTDWYTHVEGGTSLVTDQIEYTPNNISGTGLYTYYVEARSLENGCVSSVRTEITLTVLDPPVYAFVGANCTEDLQSYTAIFYSDATMIQTTQGIISDDGNGVWSVSGIPAGVNAQLLITSLTGCMINKTISAPSCECDDIEAPICRGQIITCEGIDYDGFVAFVPDGYLIRWYDSDAEGSLLAEGETFKPSLAGKYYAKAVDANSGCVSNERAEVELVIKSIPNLQVVNTVLCVGDTIVWTNLVMDLDSTIGSTAVFANFRDALNNENPLSETSVVINEIGAYFFRKTTDAGCYDIETIIVVPEDCGNTCLAEAGIYEASEEVCFDGELAILSIVEVNQATIPTRYSEIFILSVGDEKEISHSDLIPEFVVDAPGQYRIHSGVFNPADMRLDDIPEDLTTIDQFISYFMNEGTDICISIDPIGVLFDVDMCTDVCGAFAGNPIGGDIECLGENPVILAVELNPLDIIIPEGYQQIFVLTTGPELIIMGAQTEMFSVNAPGEYRVHSLVFDPLTLDLSLVEPGVTTGFDVFNLLMEGGGDICASLDLNGALFNVTECIAECTAQIGTFEVAEVTCFDGQFASIYADEIDQPTIPEGYMQIFLFSVGNEKDIIESTSIPSLDVAESGEYRMHAIVFNPDEMAYDSFPDDVYTIDGLIAFLDQYEGGLCYSIDSEGLLFSVIECIPECLAESGNTEAVSPICFDGVPVALEVEVIDDQVVPEGFVSSFLITEGNDFIVIGLQPGPFEISGPGNYEVNAIVFDPVTFDETSIEFGVTDFFDVNSMLTFGGGEVCGSIDFFGATFFVEECVVLNEDVDLELSKEISNNNPSVGEEVTFTISVFNNSENIASGVAVADRLPSGYSLTGNISDGGISEEDDSATEILWAEITILPMTTERLTFTAIVNSESSDEDYKNTAEVVASNQNDPDSTPNNDDGDQSEDDEANVMPVIEAPSVDLELIKVANLTSVQADEQITYNLNLSNRSMTMATGVAVEDIIPDGLDLASITNISNDGEVVGDRIVWTGLELGFLSNMNLTYSANVNTDADVGSIMNIAQVTACDQSDIDSTPNNDDGDQSEDDEDNAIINVVASLIDLSLSKDVNNPTPSPGETVSFEITVNNNGIIPATGVSVTDVLPPSGFDLGSITNVQPAAQVVGNSLVWTINEIFPNDEVVLSFDIIVTPNGDDYKNIAEITSANEQDSDSTPNNDDGDQSEDDEDSVSVTPVIDTEIIDLEVDKDVSELSPNIGDIIIYEVLIVNNGPFDATNVMLQDVTPDGIDAIDVSGDHIQEDGVITWTIPLLAAGDNMVFEYSSMVFESITNNYTNVVQVVGVDQQDIDSSPDNDDGDQSEDDEASSTIFPKMPNDIIDLEVSKFVDDPCAGSSDRVTFTIDIFNNSNAIATGVNVEDVFTNGFVQIEDISNGGSIDESIISWAGLSFLPGETISLSYSAMISTSGISYVNIAQVTAADQTDLDSTPYNDDGDQSEDDEAVITMDGGREFDLELEKLVDNPFAQPGDRVRFDITVNNVGCKDASGVAIRDIIPSGYKAIRNITDFGTRGGNVIIWEDLSIDAGSSKAVSFTAEIVHFSINCDYINVAEILEADQIDIDSSPGNDDGDQSEDDEDTAEVYAGSMADLELTLSSDKMEVVTGEIITYTLQVCNNGPANATGVEIRDYLPEGVQVIGELPFKGSQNGQEITWSGFTFIVNTCLDISFEVEVLEANTSNTKLNAAEIVISEQLDPDSSPGNGNGDVAEDDYAEVEVSHFVALPSVLTELPNVQEVSLNTALYLEGAFNSFTGELNTTLNKLGYLPGQKPGSFFAESTPAGQPYRSGPWYYKGNEGLIYDAKSDFSIDYPENAVDWILVDKERINQRRV